MLTGWSDKGYEKGRTIMIWLDGAMRIFGIVLLMMVILYCIKELEDRL